MADSHDNEGKGKGKKDDVQAGKVKVTTTKVELKDAHDDHKSHGFQVEPKYAIGALAAAVVLGLMIGSGGFKGTGSSAWTPDPSGSTSGGIIVALTSKNQPLPSGCRLNYEVIRGSIDLVDPKGKFITVSAGENGVVFPPGFAPTHVRAHSSSAAWKPTYRC